jgi:hypothetical protein
MTGKILKELPTLCIQYLTQLFNAILLRGYFPTHWKVAQIILIPKPGKPPHQLSSYRPVSLLPIASKVFEKLLLKRLLPQVEHANLTPNHQFGFRPRHSTIGQTHRLNRALTDAPENSQYCSLLHFLISLKPSTRFGMRAYCKSSDDHSHSTIISSSIPICLIATSLLKSTLNSQALPQSTQGFLKAVSSTHYYTYFIQLTFQLRLTPSLPPLPTTLQSLPLIMILPLLPKNCKPPSSLFNPAYVIGELKLMSLSRSM